MGTDRVARIATVVAVVALGAVGLALRDSVLLGGIAWLTFLFFVLSGWGWLVAKLARVEDPDFGLRAAWGIAAYLAVAGIPVMLGVFSRPVILAVIAIGTAAFAWRELVTPRPVVAIARSAAAYIRANPLIAYVIVLVAAAVLIQVVHGVARLDRNAWDDDIAYTPLLKRLLDSGDLIEPFSFRRLASYGGQTVLQGLVGARGNLASVHALDQGLCFGLVFLLIIGHARTLRTSAFWLAIIVLTVLLMPDVSINTASYWSGAVCFLALYRTLSAQNVLVAALIAAMTCTLRQNYIPVAGLFIVLSLAFSRAPRTTWIRVLALIGAVMLPWCIAAFVSNKTFLFPFMKGTWNEGLTMGPSGWTWFDELQLFINTVLYTEPFVVVLIVAPLIVFATDDRKGRPLHAFFIASLFGFALLVHSFTDADSSTMWRYAFGYAITLFAVFALEASGEAETAPVRLVPLGRWILVGAMLLQLAGQRAGQVKSYALVLGDIRDAAQMEHSGDPSANVEHQRHAAMQATVPAGARLLVMLDDAYFLDFARNRVANLDVPGFASPGTPQMPYFAGSEAKRSYLLDNGYRYVAFVRPERSRYAFRREFWVWRVFHDIEFFQAMSEYSIDAIESFVELSKTSTVLYDQDGLVVLDLDKPHGPAPVLDPKGERLRREQWTAELARRENLEREYRLTNRYDFIFVDGCSGLVFTGANDNAGWKASQVTEAPDAPRGEPIRWLSRRVHVRVRGEQDMHLVLRGRVMENKLYTRARLDVSLDGVLLASTTTDATGQFVIDVTIDHAKLTSWSDLYLVFNSVGQPERDISELKLARLEDVTWEPR